MSEDLTMKYKVYYETHMRNEGSAHSTGVRTFYNDKTFYEWMLEYLQKDFKKFNIEITKEWE